MLNENFGLRILIDFKIQTKLSTVLFMILKFILK